MIRKLVLILALAAIPMFGQQLGQPGNLLISCSAVTTTGACTTFAVNAPQASTFTWQTSETGSPASVTVNFEGSLDNVTFTTLDTTSTTTGTFQTVSGKPMRFVRCNVTTLSGGSSPTLTCQITISATSGGGGGVTSLAATGPIAVSASTGAVTVSCPTCGTSTGTVTTTGSPANGNLAKFSGATSVTNTNLSGDATTSGASAVTVVALNGTNLAGLSTGILKNTTATGVPSIAVGSDLPTSGIPNVVYNNTTNAGTTAMTLDLSLATTANAFKVPIGAGLTAGADGVIAYDTTNKNTHVRANGADALAAFEAAALAGGAIPKAGGSNLASMAASSITDNGTLVSTAEPIRTGTAGSNANIDLTIGYLASAMTQQTTATCTNITNMTWTINASKNYRLVCEIPVTLAATATLQFCLNGPGSPTHTTLDAWGPIGTAGVYFDGESIGTTSWGGKTTASGAAANTSVVHVTADIQNGSTASGTALTLQTAANGTNAITVLADSACKLEQVN